MSRRLALITLLALLALAAVGCGDDEDATTGTLTEPAPSGEAEPRVYFGFIKAKTAPGGGAEVVKVEGGSQLEAAGLRAGDVIVAVDGAPLAGGEEVTAAFEEVSFGANPGDTLEIEVERDSKKQTLEVLLAPNVLLGIEVYDAEDKRTGEPALGVKSVPPGEPAAEAGLKPPAVIRELDGEPVENTADLFTALGDNVAGDDVELTIDGKQGEETLTVTVADRTQTPEAPPDG